jgi:diguanylate cyclase (GGDEF)-like protein
MEEELYRLTITDPLTGAFNRRYLMQVLDMETRRAQRYGRPLSLIMFDLDHFKQINDTFGHQQGDQVLKDVATRVQQRLRRTDHFVRWGGEEFMILTTETARSEALALTEILHHELRDTPFPEIGRVTASFGVSEYRLHEALDEWLKRVDDLVYVVKRDGRNHIQHDGD